jgi:hypothetical protein
MIECTQEKYNIIKSSLENRDVTVLIAKHAVQVTYYQSNHHISLILKWPMGPVLKV